MIEIILIYCVLLIIFVLLSGFFEGAETGMISANRLKLRNLKLAGDEKAENILDLLADTQKIIAVSLVGTNLFNILGTLTADRLFGSIIPGKWEINLWGMDSTEEIVTLVVMTPVFLIFAQILPKQLFRLNADALLMKTSGVIRFARILFLPLAVALSAVARALLWLVGIRHAIPRTKFSKEDLQLLIHPERRTDEHLTTEKDMIHGIFDLERTLALQVMIPLADVVSIRLGDMSRDGFLNLARRTGYTRFPVFIDRVVNLIGHINVYDVLNADDPSKPLDDFIQKPYYVPQTKRVDDLLQEFLEKRLRLVFTVNEYGGCTGMITGEDLMEEIVGDIEDEFDAEPPDFVDQPDGSCIVEGQVPIDDLNQRLGTHIPKVNCETIGGFVLSSLGAIPNEGHTVYSKNCEIEVVEMDDLRIDKVRIRKRGTHI